MSSSLVDPPKIRQSDPEQNLAPVQALEPAAADTNDVIVDLMVDNFHAIKVVEEPPMGMGRTENNSPTFLSSSNPCLDFFFQVVPKMPPETLTHSLELAWQHDPLTTLKLICNMRSVRGTGKSDREGFYAAALWLHQNHPKTLACNVRSFAEFGYFKDLPEILYRLLEGLSVREDIRMVPAIQHGYGRKKSFSPPQSKIPRWQWKMWKVQADNQEMLRKELKKSIPLEERLLREAKKTEMLKDKARQLKHEKRAAMTQKAMDWYMHKSDYRHLHDRISDVFVELLVNDLHHLNSGEVHKISLASKWCPSLDCSLDRRTLLCGSIAKKIFPRESHPEYEGIEEPHYVYRVRDRLRREVLVPLRQALQLPEIYITSNCWNSLPYHQVSSVAMKTYKKLFYKYDELRFKEYLSKVTRGKAKIAAGALLPHEILAGIKYKNGTIEEDLVAELQWHRMVEDLSKGGKLKNCLAICDVSPDMLDFLSEFAAIEVAIALGLLTSELSEDPWKNKLITFSEDPTLRLIEGDTLRSKMKFIRYIDGGESTNFQKAFDLILEVAVNGNLSEEQMIKRVFVFSDMDFDEASENPWETDYEAICRKFHESGYQKVPEMVFWNLRNSRSTPLLGTQKGVALVSGFSKNLLTMFLDGGGINNPEAVMERAIAGPEYQNLVLVD